VADVKKGIEAVHGDVYPAAQQMLIHQGKVLKDETTLQENNVAENSFVVIMLTKAQPASSLPPATQPAPASQAPVSTVGHPAPESVPVSTPSEAASLESDVYGVAASNLVAGSHLETTIQQILDMGGGSWDRDTVIRALRAAFNNPERAVEYLYSGIPAQAEVPPVAQAPAGGQAVNPPAQIAQPAVPSGGPNANPLDLFPQGLPSVGSNASAGNLDFLRNSQQFQALRAMVQANPQILQVILIENILGELAGAMPQTVNVTPEERDAIERLEAMGFDRAIVLEVFFACNKNEELAANYLLDHMHEFDE
ncbi:hypothetical protein RJ639_009102, partial [Escallonia herrerae]